MAVNLKGRDFLKLLDFSAEEITYFLDLAAELKDKKKKGKRSISISPKRSIRPRFSLRTVPPL